MKSGRIIYTGGDIPEPHEFKTAKILAKYGNVEFIEPVRIKGIHTPDVLWQGKKWEIKSSTGNGKYLIHNTLKRAALQSENVIIDLHRFKGCELNALKLLKIVAPSYKKIKRLKVIAKNSKIFDIK